MKTQPSPSGATIAAETTDFVRSVFAEWETEARRSPLKAAAYAIGAGLVLRLLPIRQITFALFRLVLVLLKPAAFALGFYKLYELLIGHEWKAADLPSDLHSSEMGE